MSRSERRCRIGLAGALCCLFATIPISNADAGEKENWPGWRGPRGDGTSLETGLPLHWGPDQNIVWTADVQGVGHSSPIVWNDRVFLTTCELESNARTLLCFDRSDGKLLWRQVVVESPLEFKHDLNSFASGTPATDGELVYTGFLDKQEMVVAAYDLDGERRWSVRPGVFSSRHGFCSCPVLFENLVIVNGDHDGDSYIVALDRATGRTVWKVPREHKTRSYVTPIVREIDGRTQMILSGSMCVTSYDPRTGGVHWSMQGPTEQFVASLVYNGELLFLTAGYPEHHMLAIRPDGRGDVTDTHIAWRTQDGASYVPSPIAVEDYFLVVSDGGIASCFEATTGQRHWKERIGPRYSASLVTAEGLVYFLSDEGVTTIVRPGPRFEAVAENELGENCYASPAIHDGQLLIRGENRLFCIGEPRSP